MAALNEGITPKILGDTAAEGIAMGKGEPFTWAITVARSRHAAGPTAPGGITDGNRQHGRRESVAERAER
ncbi:MAG: hypothetical protein L0H70_04160, partial [Xanthomonadales bacterium]|nr:hypothetical protein [Xanthomonadales bacterium]